jgi:Transglycosylase SLT domain
MLKGSGLLTAALVAVLAVFIVLFTGGRAAAKGEDAPLGSASVFKTNHNRAATVQAQRWKKHHAHHGRRGKIYARAELGGKVYARHHHRGRIYASRHHRHHWLYASHHRRGWGYASLHRRHHAIRMARRASPAIIAAVTSHARWAHVPVGVALAIVRHESGFNPRATGRAGEIGLMQIKCSTARGMGYSGGCRGLYNVSTNLSYGMRYLRMALNRGSVAYYNAGIGAKRLPWGARRYAAAVHRKIRRV